MPTTNSSNNAEDSLWENLIATSSSDHLSASVLLVIFALWWLKETDQQVSSVTRLQGWISLFILLAGVYAGVGTVVAILLVAKLYQKLETQYQKLAKMNQKVTKLTKQLQDQEHKIGILEEKVGSLQEGRAGCNNGMRVTPRLQRLGKQISDRLSKMVRDLKDWADESKDKKDEPKEVDTSRDESTFIFEVQGAEALLAAGSKKRCATSRLFYCKSIPWFLYTDHNQVDGVDYLAVSLHHRSPIDHNYCSVVATFEIRLLSSDGAHNDVFGVGTNAVFTKTNSNAAGLGWSRFIAVDKLRAGSFIQNDTIKIRAQLSDISFEKIALN